MPSGPTPRLRRWLVANQTRLSLLLLFAWTEQTAWRLPEDTCYDLLNYHLYGPFALLHGKWGRDLAPAQTQGFLPPTNDMPFYLLTRHVGSVHVLHLLLALPAVAAICLAFLVTSRLLRARDVAARLAALAAVVIGATGAAAHPVLATSMSDMIPCALVLGAVLLLSPDAAARADAGGRARGLLRPMLPGLLVGIALGLKLTVSYVAVGLVVAMLGGPEVPPVRRLRAAFLFCVAAALAAMAVGGGWWLFLWRSTGNPLFPLYNNVFRSPLAWPGDFVDRRFFPRDALQWLFYPVFWALDRAPLVTEPDLPMRDARIALALLGAILTLSSSRDRAARFASLFYLVAFAVWEYQFSIFRYLSPLELLSGTMMVMPMLAITHGEPGRRIVLVVSVLLLAALRMTTVYPNWGRLPAPGGRPLAIDAPNMPPDSLVLLLDNAPLAYLAVFEPDSVRFFGTNNNLTQPQQGGMMQARIRAAIAEQRTDLYGVEKPDVAPGMADRTLAAYGLHRAGCRAVTGAIVGASTRICLLGR